MAEDCPSDHHFTMLKSFCSWGFAHEVADDDANAGFGSGSTFHAFAHAWFIFKSVPEFAYVAGAEAAADAIFF